MQKYKECLDYFEEKMREFRYCQTPYKFKSYSERYITDYMSADYSEYNCLFPEELL